MAVNPKLRWAILHRDNYACRYCGTTGGRGVVLHVDHVLPRSRGGKDIASNLVTACENCNSGKSDTPLCASPIEDVPQEIFRRSCAERGISNPACPAGDGCDHEQSLARRILDNYYPEEQQQFIEYERQWLEEGEPASDADLEDQAAQEAYYSESRDRRRLEQTVERLLLHHDQDDIRRHEAGALAHLTERAAEREEGYVPPPQRSSVVLAITVERFLDELDKGAFLSLPTQEQEEWLDYAVALHGPTAVDPQRGWTPEQKVTKAARIVRAISVGRYYPIMCRARGVVITACPRRAQHLVRLEQCGACRDDGYPDLHGHEYCEEHLQLIVAGEYITRVGETLVAVDYTDLAVGA
jgi:hypothetical protein